MFDIVIFSLWIVDRKFFVFVLSWCVGFLLFCVLLVFVCLALYGIGGEVSG